MWRNVDDVTQRKTRRQLCTYVCMNVAEGVFMLVDVIIDA